MERWRDLEREKKRICEKEDAGKGTLYRGNPNLEGRYFGFSKIGSKPFFSREMLYLSFIGVLEYPLNTR